MIKKISIRKWIVAIGVFSVLTIALSSCGDKEGCPGKITETGVTFDPTGA